MKYIPNWLNPFKQKKKLSAEDKYRVNFGKALDKVHFNNGDENFGDREFYNLMRGACMNSVLLNNQEFLDIASTYFNRYQRMLQIENQRRVVTNEIRRRYDNLIDLAKRGIDFEGLEESVIDYTDRVRIVSEAPLREEYVIATRDDGDGDGHRE